jgi:hypothetical protein
MNASAKLQLAPAVIRFRTITRKLLGGWPAALVPDGRGGERWYVWASLRQMRHDIEILAPGFELIEDQHQAGCDEGHCQCPGIRPPRFEQISPFYATTMDDNDEF